MKSWFETSHGFRALAVATSWHPVQRSRLSTVSPARIACASLCCTVPHSHFIRLTMLLLCIVLPLCKYSLLPSVPARPYLRSRVVHISRHCSSSSAPCCGREWQHQLVRILRSRVVDRPSSTAPARPYPAVESGIALLVPARPCPAVESGRSSFQHRASSSVSCGREWHCITSSSVSCGREWHCITSTSSSVSFGREWQIVLPAPRQLVRVLRSRVALLVPARPYPAEHSWSS